MPSETRFTANQPQIKTEDIGDARLTYLDYEGSGPALIFLHATGFLPWLWHPIARELSSSYRVIAPYFCDHREADPEAGGLNWMTVARDFVSLCTHLHIEDAFLVGHSMGATVLTIATAHYGFKADGMVLIEPIFLPSEWYHTRITVDQHPLASKSIKRRNNWRDASEAREYLLSRGLFKQWDDEMLDLYIRHGLTEGATEGLQLACSPRKEAALFMGGLHFDPWPLLPKVACPVLVMEGQKSDNRHFIDLKKATALFPEGTYRLVENSGHLIPMECPGETSVIISDFFRPLLPPS